VEVSLMTSDIKTAAQNRASIPLEALRRARPRRVLARAVALLLVLGAGWFAGV